jgi:hypothetical protein
MSFRRTLIALLLAVTWCSAALHSDLEAVGLMLDHAHHHVETDHEHADHDHGATSLPVGSDSHDPVWASHILKDSLAAMATPVLLAALCVLAVWIIGRHLLALTRAPESVPRRRPPDQSTVWQFVWRCAPDSAAPPALS